MSKFRQFNPPSGTFKPLKNGSVVSEGDGFQPGLPVRRLEPFSRVELIIGDQTFRAWTRPASPKKDG